MLSQQADSYCIDRQPSDLYSLGSGLVAGNYCDVPAGQVERAGEERDEGIVRRAIDGRCRKPNQEGTVPHSIDGAASRSWNDANIKNRELQTVNC
jgi:hypothetical protein